jgi:hypothetical protein
MTFANVNMNREQLTLLSQLLLTAFPGCIIHQSCDPVRTITHLSTQRVDAVFTDADTYPDLMHLLNTQNAKASVYLLCRHDAPLPEESTAAKAVTGISPTMITNTRTNDSPRFRIFIILNNLLDMLWSNLQRNLNFMPCDRICDHAPDAVGFRRRCVMPAQQINRSL